MFTRLLKTLVIAAILGAMGCSNQAPNNLSENNKSDENTAQPQPIVKSPVVIDGEKPIETTLYNRRVSRDNSEITVSVKTDVAIEGQTEFDLVIYGRDLGNDRYLAGYRLQDASGQVVLTSEYAANTTDLSWIELSRADGEHEWSLVVETEDRISRQTHTMDNARFIVENSLSGANTEKLTASNGGTTQQLNSFYSENESFFDKQSDKFVVSVLTNESLLLWVAGEPNDKPDFDGPQFVGGWGRLICDVIGVISASVCDEESSLYNESACSILGVANAICKVLKTLRII